MSANIETVRGAGEEKKGAVPKQSNREKDVRRVCGTAILLAEPVEEDSSLELAPTTSIITSNSRNIFRSLEPATITTTITTTTTNSSNSNIGGRGSCGSDSGNSSNAATITTTTTSVPVNTIKKAIVRKGNTKQKK